MLRRNALIFHEAALGDFILTWPIALALSRIAPQSRVIYVTHSQKGKLAERVLRVESTDSEAGWHALLQPDVSLEQLPPAIQRMLDGAHIAIVFRGAAPDKLIQTLQRLQPDLRIIEIVTAPQPTQHIAETLIGQTQTWPPLHAASQQILGGIRQRGLSIVRQPTVDVLIHPGSGGGAKRWPPERFVELAKRLRAAGRSIKFVVGEVELEGLGRQTLETMSSLTAVAQPTTYIELSQEIAGAEAYVGNDSGPTHLAAIVGTPTVAIFGPTDPAVWAPVGPRLAILRGDPLDSLTVDAVHAAIDALS